MRHMEVFEGKLVWPHPLPMAEAPKDARILAYFGPNHSGWYVTRWYKSPAGRSWAPYWCPEGEIFGSRWARKNQPQCWLPLPPNVTQVWEFQK